METDSGTCERIENNGKKLTITTQRNTNNNSMTNNNNNSSTLDEIEIALYSGMGRKTQHEEPMDLTFSQKQIQKISLGKSLNRMNTNNQQEITLEKPNSLTATNQLLYTTSNGPKKRGRKRKDAPAPSTKEDKSAQNIKLIYRIPNYDLNNPEHLNTMDNRQAEVLLAAKSLFSKRTRTLYHWMYPNTPKAQLKSAVSLSWETLGIQEKEFYISQVLGRFGFPQSSLMVNPQLGGLRGNGGGGGGEGGNGGFPAIPPLDLSSPNQINLETRNAVSTILDQNHQMENQNPNENELRSCGNVWNQCGLLTGHVKKMNNKKRGRIGRPSGKVSKNNKNSVRAVNVENINEEFQDDPELRKEFEQFKWALHMTDKKN